MKDKCPNCGNIYNPKKTFTCPMCGQEVQGLDYSFIYGDKDKNYKEEREYYGNLRWSFGLEDSIAHELFDIVKKANSLFNKGFSPSIDYIKLCQDVGKWNLVPDPSRIKIISNPDDSKTQNPFDVLGLFGISKSNGKKTIVLNPKKIIDEIGKGVAALTLLHELMHAAMYVGENEPEGWLPLNAKRYWYYKEEAYANTFALKLLQQSSHNDWFCEALEFVEQQPDGYNTGALLLKENISMQCFIEEKRDPNSVSSGNQEIWLNTWIISQ